MNKQVKSQVLYLPIKDGKYLVNSRYKVRAYKSISSLERYTKPEDYDEIIALNVMCTIKNIGDEPNCDRNKSPRKFKRLLRKLDKKVRAIVKIMDQLGGSVREINIQVPYELEKEANE